MSKQEKGNSATENQAVNSTPGATTVGRQVTLTLKLIGILALLGGLLWFIDKIAVQ